MKDFNKVALITGITGQDRSYVVGAVTRSVATMRPPPYLGRFLDFGSFIHLMPTADLEKTFHLVLRPKVRVLVNHVYRRGSLLEEDCAFAMRQAKEAAEQLTRSSKLQDLA